LAKADLLTDMVSEFPELQGIMGMYYARSEGLPEAVAFAIEDHYKPRFAGDSLARGRAGILVALADKLETLVGLFGIAQAPSGDKDPFALRRHALGIVRMIVDGNLNLPLTPMLEAVAAVFGDKLKVTHAQLIEQIKGFIYDRMSNALKEQGFSVKEVDAVTAQGPELIAQIPLRVAAVHEFSSLAEAPALAAANKRIGNILKKEEVSTEGALSVKPEHFALPQEQALFDALQALAHKARAKLDHMQFAAALVELAALKAPVDAFFDHVMVNDPNEQLRQNRLALLGSLHTEMNRVADLARLA
jgi:glycyl-tRNA synthetase beta chain